MKKIFTIYNLPCLVLVVYLIKSFIVNPTFFDFGVILIMATSFLYTLYLNKSHINDKQELKDIISQLEEKVNEKIEKVQITQNDDRMTSESKFSTIQMNLHRQQKPQDKAAYGWG